MSTYYRKLTNESQVGNCECCNKALYGNDPVVTSYSHISPITRERETIYENRRFCRDCADMLHAAINHSLREKVKQHRLENEGGQLALFS